MLLETIFGAIWFYSCVINNTCLSNQWTDECLNNVVEFEVYDIVQTIENLELSEMVKALDSVGLNEDYFLEAGSNFTVFAPTDEAFQKYLGITSVAPGITLQVTYNLPLCKNAKLQIRR